MKVFVSGLILLILSLKTKKILVERRKIERKTEGDNRRKMWTERFGNGSPSNKEGGPSSDRKGKKNSYKFVPFL